MGYTKLEGGIIMLWRVCGWCKSNVVIGCYDNNGDKRCCKGCQHQNCPSPLAESSTGICDDCLQEWNLKRVQSKNFDGVGVS